MAETCLIKDRMKTDTHFRMREKRALPQRQTQLWNFYFLSCGSNTQKLGKSTDKFATATFTSSLIPVCRDTHLTAW